MAWRPCDDRNAVEWITAELVRVTCCDETFSLYPASADMHDDGCAACPQCGKRYRLIVRAEVLVCERG